MAAKRGDDGVRQELKKAFDEADVDNKGYLTVAQAKAVLERILEFTLEDRITTRIISAADADGSRNINFEEFCTSAKDLVKVLKELVTEFQIVDYDQSGFLGASELTELLNRCSCGGLRPDDHAVYDFLEHIDKDGDGRISFHEFLNFMADDICNRRM